MKRTLAFLIALGCARFIVSAGEAAGPKPGEKPPPLGFESMLQRPGSAQSSWEGLKGKVVVLEFWATWCGPCIAAIPHLNELADKFQDGSVQFIAVTDEDENVVGPFLRKKPMRAWIGLDTDKSMFKDYGIRGIPHTVVVDQKGIIAAITYPTSLKQEHLKDLLAGKKISFEPPGTQERVPSDRVSAISKPERESLVQVVIWPNEGGPTSSSSSRGSLKVSGATVLDMLSSSYSISPARIVTNSALPEGRFDFVIKTPNTGNEGVQALLLHAVESAFGVTARHESREMDVFVLKSGQPTEHLKPTVSPGGSSMSSGGGSLHCVNQSMNSFARSLEEILTKPVINETGLTNQYDFQLLWNEKESGETDPIELTKELHEQLGLELTPAMRAVDVLVTTVANRQADPLAHRVAK